MAARRKITTIVTPPGLGPRAQLDCGHLANILARDAAALERRVGTERICCECPGTITREVVHYGLGITDCGRDGASLPPSHKWTMDRAIVSCGECLDARAHLDAKVQKGRVH